MKNITSPLLPFKLDVTEDKITANSGLVLLAEFIYSLRFWQLIGKDKSALAGMGRCNYALNKKVLKITGKKEFTLDIHAS